MSSASRKRKSLSPSAEGQVPAKRRSPTRHSVSSGVPSKHCSTCGGSYTNEKSHRASCTQQEVACVYPDPKSNGHGERVTLRRVDGYFKCIRCRKLLKKDQNMKNHTRECYGTRKDMEAEEPAQPALPPVSNAELTGIVSADVAVGTQVTADVHPSSTLPVLTSSSPGPVNAPILTVEGTSGLLAASSGSHPSRKEGPSIFQQLISQIPLPRSVNEHELRVFPDEHSIIHDDLLRFTPYIVNTKYMVLICFDCRYCIVPNRALEHLRKDHPQCRIRSTFPEQLQKKFPRLVDEAVHPVDTVECIFGLAIPVEKYTVCTRCRRGYVNVTTWQRHDCRSADTDLARKGPHFPSYVQTFFRGPRTCYFAVELPDFVTDRSHDDDFDLFKRDFHERPVLGEEIHDSEDYRQLNQFLLKEGWIEHVSGFSASALSHLAAFPKDGEVLEYIARDVIALMCNIQTAIGAAGYHVQRLLGKRPSYVLSFSMFGVFSCKAASL